jgi:hypothetical protein
MGDPEVLARETLSAIQDLPLAELARANWVT